MNFKCRKYIFGHGWYIHKIYTHLCTHTTYIQLAKWKELWERLKNKGVQSGGYGGVVVMTNEKTNAIKIFFQYNFLRKHGVGYEVPSNFIIYVSSTKKNMVKLL